jgi:hypothetical protein
MFRGDLILWCRPKYLFNFKGNQLILEGSPIKFASKGGLLRDLPLKMVIDESDPPLLIGPSPLQCAQLASVWYQVHSI